MDNSNSTSASASGDRTFAILAHIGGFFTSWIGPLIIFLIKKSDPQEVFVTDQAKEALNFQIMTFLVYMAFVITVVGVFLILIPIIWNLVFSIIASVKASNGVAYRYPLIFRIIQ